MTESIRESLSAIMDGEANELELERVLRQMGEDGELRQSWVRYHVARTVCSGQQVSQLMPDISARVRDEIAGSGSQRQAGRRRWQGWLQPVGSFAVAASVAATVVIGGQQLSQLGSIGDGADDALVTAGAAPVGMVNSLGATSVQASYGTQSVPVLQPATRTAYQELARQRMMQYSQEHAEQAALNTPQGLLPFARVPQIQE